jgi:rod shape determining protein RodA
MLSVRSLVKSIDWIIVAAIIVLMLIGVLFIYSSGVNSDGILINNEYIKQIVWVVSGLVLMLALTVVEPKRLPDYTALLYGFMILLLVYTRIFGKVVNGARSWLGLFGDLGIQPSEFMKIAAILFLARYLDSTKHELDSFRRFAVSFGIMLLPMALILSQPDFGTALVYFPLYLGVAFIGGIALRYLSFLLLTGSIAIVMTVMPLWQGLVAKESSIFLRVFYEEPYVFFVIALAGFAFALSVLGYRFFKKRYYYWLAFLALSLILGLSASILGHIVLKDYQIMRLVVFLDPSVDPLGSGWNIVQSITAIGSGGFAGKGFLQGTQSHYRYLPQQSTDFIFSIISEELGFIGGFIIFTLFLVIALRLLLSLRTLSSAFQRNLIAGVVTMILFHFMINAGMAMGIMPITGIPLLFLSYGGSSLWAICMGIGLCLGIGARRYDL